MREPRLQEYLTRSRYLNKYLKQNIAYCLACRTDVLMLSVLSAKCDLYKQAKYRGSHDAK